MMGCLRCLCFFLCFLLFMFFFFFLGGGLLCNVEAWTLTRTIAKAPARGFVAGLYGVIGGCFLERC